MDKEKQIDIVSRYHAKNDLANALYQRQDEFDLSNPFEVANCVINLGYHKINKNEVVISKEEYEGLINQNKGLKEENHILRLENNDLEAQVELKSKETAEKIFRELIKRAENISFFDCRMGLDLDEIAKQFGVDLGE